MAKLLSLALVTLLPIAIMGVEANLRIAEGKKCPHSSGVTGICSKISNCPGEFEAITKNRASSTICSFQKNISIICCIVGQPGVKSVQACNRLKEMIPDMGVSSISNGVLAREKFPHMALLGYDVPDVADEGPWKCGGSLVSEHFVLTAAHCIVTRFGNVTKIRLGAKNWRKPDRNVQDFEVEHAFIHPDYKPPVWYNDIALIKLKGKVRLTGNIYPACLYALSTEPESLIISGWGQTGPNSQDFNDELLEGKYELKVVNSVECTRRYNRLETVDKSVPIGVNSMMFCASDNRNSIDLSSDTCQGDSGGPIQLRLNSAQILSYTVVGITSGGSLCGGEPPGIYTRVYYYLDWIERIIYPS